MIDKLLSRASHIAQIVLVAVAVFGYFYTVVPVYQKDLLSEEISQKEIELIKLKEESKNFPQVIKEFEDKAQGLEKSITELEQAKAEAVNSLAVILDEKTAIQNSLTKARQQLQSARNGADEAYKEIYLESFKGAVLFQYLKHMPNSYDILEKQEKASIDSFLVTPYEAIQAVLDDGDPKTLESTRLVPNRIKNAQNSVIRAKLIEHKHVVSVPLIDIEHLVSEYNIKMAENDKDATPEDRFNEAQYSLNKEYADRLSKALQAEMERSSQFMEQF